MRFFHKSFGAGVLTLAVLTSLPGGEISNRKMVWAHHVPWHTPFNTSLTALNYYNFPLLDSAGKELEDWKQEIAQAKAQGIDGFFPDLVAKPGGPTAFSDTLPTMLKAAEGSDFQVGVCLDVKTTVDHQVAELVRMLKLFGNHPNYPRWNGRPVVNFYTYLAWKPDEIAAIRAGVRAGGFDIFIIGNFGSGYEKRDADSLRPYVQQCDMIYSFTATEIDGTTMQHKVDLYQELAAECGKEFMTTVYPGYYGAWLNGRNDFYQVHRGLDQAHDSFLAANTPEARFLHFTTWNDHDETSFLPMVFTPGNALITKAYADSFTGRSLVTGKPEVVFAYHREELPGTLLRFEAMTLPTLKDGQVEISGQLLDASGNAVANLAAKQLAGTDFDRVEWLIPSTGLAEHPVLIPEFSINGTKVRLPEMLLISGWHQNAVTVKVAASQLISQESSLHIACQDGVLKVKGNYSAPEMLKRITLWRNDRPVAVILPETSGKVLGNLQISGLPDYTVTPEGGVIVSGVRKFGENGSRGFQWDAKSLTSRYNQSWTPVALTIQGSPDMKLQFAISGSDPLVISASELAQREQINYGGLTISSLMVDGTMQNRPALNRREGAFDFSLFAPEPRPHDRYALFFETADGRIGWSLPVWPFATERKTLPVKLLETAENLETPSDGTGWAGRKEFLQEPAAFRTPKLKSGAISPLSIRGGHWDFENSGRDTFGDMPIQIPETMFTAGKEGEGSALRFTGKESVKMRLRTYPAGPVTIDFLLKPEGGRTKRQGLITRTGGSGAVNVYLLPDGRIEAVRNGNLRFRPEAATSHAAVPDNSWSRVRVTSDESMLRIYLDGTLAAERKIAPQRSYGNCTWFLGQGDADSGNYTGCLDDVTVFGAAFAPGSPDEPEIRRGKSFAPILPPGAPEADEAGGVTGHWKFPAHLERRAAGSEAPGFAREQLASPVLIGGESLQLGPGANTVQVPAEGVELKEGTILSIPLKRFERAEPKHSWYALLISIGNGAGRSLNFNFGSDKQVMITAFEPKWTIRSGNFPLTLPVDLRIAKRNGQVIFLLQDKVIYRTADDPEAPYTKLSFSTSSPNRKDATIIQIGAPKQYRLR